MKVALIEDEGMYTTEGNKVFSELSVIVSEYVQKHPEYKTQELRIILMDAMAMQSTYHDFMRIVNRGVR